MNGVKINDLPKFLAAEPDESTHALQVDNPLDEDRPLFILFHCRASQVIFQSESLLLQNGKMKNTTPVSS